MLHEPARLPDATVRKSPPTPAPFLLFFNLFGLFGLFNLFGAGAAGAGAHAGV